MIAKVRNLKFSPAFEQTHKTNFKNLLVSGCSYVWNNSEDHVCTWPYTLKDIAGFNEVYDCSQSGSGPGNTFNSIIHEIETNTSLTTSDTLVIVMWPELTRFDTISHRSITKDWHHMSNYDFNESLSTLSLFRNTHINSELEKLCSMFHKLVDPNGIILENIIKVQALDSYLRDKGFTRIFLSWKRPIDNRLIEYLDFNSYLDDWTEEHNMRIPGDGHPTPEAHLQWTRLQLIPFLTNQKIIESL